MSVAIMNLVTPKAGARQDLLLNEPTSDARLFDHLSPTQVAQQSVTKII